MNKGDGWKMEKLTSLTMGFSMDEVPVSILEVEDGEVYIDTHEPGLKVESLTGLKELYRCRASNSTSVAGNGGHFDLLRIARAVGQGFEEEVTAVLVNVHISRHSAVGVVFGHTDQGPHGRYADGHLIQTSDILATTKEGRFWVVTTINSRYVIATFQRDGVRRSFNEFRRLVGNRYPST